MRACQEGIKYFKEHALKHFEDEEKYMELIGAPLCGRHPGKSPDALLGRRVGALSRIAEQAGSGGEVDD